MATITTIKQRIEQLDAGHFQILCDAYLSREGYPNLVALGTKAGTSKTTLGTPDTYFCMAGDKYVFAEYTTQKDELVSKIQDDLEKCFDVAFTGIPANLIAEIVYCHTSSNLPPKKDTELKQYCIEKGVALRLIGIDFLAEELSRKYPVIVKDHLGLTIDTEQIRSLPDFVSHYDSNELAAPLNTNFQYRQHETELISSMLDRCDVVVLTGVAGAGKTRLALKYANDYSSENGYKLFIIHSNGLPLFEDLKLHFERPGNYFVVIDDANQISQLGHIIEYVKKKSDGYNVKMIITVRSYALDRVKTDLRGKARYEELSIGAFSDDEIKSIVKDQFGIANYRYLNRIAQIAEGNARIAIIAGRIATDANRLDSINDASELYEDYFGKAFQEANLEEDQQLQITAGVIAFLNSAHLDYLEPIVPVLSELGIDISVLKSCVYKLHEMELVDICHDKAVVISDQCFANFILKHVYCDKKSISLAAMLDVCFKPFREKTMLAVNTLIDVFRTKDVQDFVTKEIKAVWKKKKDEGLADFWEWVKAFYLINQEEALLMLKERIDNTEQVSLPVASIDVNERRNYINVNDDIITMLGGFANTGNLDTALELFFTYYLKRPDLFIQFYHAINMYYGINLRAVENDFYTPIRLINQFITSSNQWKNDYIRLLFFNVVGKLLQLHFSSFEDGKKANSIVICNFALRPSEGAFMYRNMIWRQILTIQSEAECKSEIQSLLRQYAGAIEDCSYGIIEKDAPFIDELLSQGFSIEDVNDCVLAEHVYSIIALTDYNSDVLQRFLGSEKLKAYHFLIGPKWDLTSDFQENKREKQRVISEHLRKANDACAAFDRLFDIYLSCMNSEAHTNWEIGEGMQRAVNYMSSDAQNCKYAAEKLVRAQRLDGIHVLDIVNSLFSYYPPEEVLSVIRCANKETLDYWLFAYYHEFPAELITDSTVQDFYKYLLCEYDRDYRGDQNRELQFLTNYEKYDPDVFIKTVQLIFNKRSYSPLIVTCYFTLLFHSQCYEAKEIIQKFGRDLALLEDIYIFECLNYNLTDLDGALLKEICEIDESFSKRYYAEVYAEKQYHRHEDSSKLQVFFRCKNYIQIVDSIVNECSNKGRYVYFDLTPVMKTFVAVPNDLVQASDTWINHYISEYNQDSDKMCALFEAIAELGNEDRKITFLRYLISCNADVELFRRIELLPREVSWSVTTFYGWIKYLEKLRPLFVGLPYLKHRIIVNEEIDRLHAMIERVEIEDVLRG